jgi:hypothetical protein
VFVYSLCTDSKQPICLRFNFTLKVQSVFFALALSKLSMGKLSLIFIAEKQARHLNKYVTDMIDMCFDLINGALNFFEI